MRRKNNVITVICAIIMIATSCNTAAKDWAFLDLNSGARAALFEEERIFVADENGTAAEFCGEGEFRCFETDFFSFAVPKDAASRSSWSYNGRAYCVVTRFSDEKSRRENDLWLIFSRVGRDCVTKEGFDQSAIYSRRGGLRYMALQASSGAHREMWATDAKGFAAGWTK